MTFYILKGPLNWDITMLCKNRFLVNLATEREIVTFPIQLYTELVMLISGTELENVQILYMDILYCLHESVHEVWLGDANKMKYRCPLPPY